MNTFVSAAFLSNGGNSMSTFVSISLVGIDCTIESMVRMAFLASWDRKESTSFKSSFKIGRYREL